MATKVYATLPATVQHLLRTECVGSFAHFCSPSSDEPETIDVSLLKNATDGPQIDLQLVYDVMRVHAQRILFESSHLARIAKTCLAVAPSCDPEALQQKAQALLHKYLNAVFGDALGEKRHNTPDQNVKIVGWKDSLQNMKGGADGTPAKIDFSFVVFTPKSFYPPAEWYVTGTTVALMYDAVRPSPNAKLLATSLRQRAEGVQTACGAFETLLVHGEDGNFLVPEGSRTNYLLVTPDKRLICSEKADILLGTTLVAVEQMIKDKGIVAIEHRKLTVRDICECASIVLLGTSIGVLPVQAVVLYHDDESRKRFEAAVNKCGARPERMMNLRLAPGKSNTALAMLEPGNEVVMSLIKAYADAVLA